MASFKTKAPRNVVGVDCIHIQHPDAKFQLCGNIVFLVLESATCGAFRLASARVVCARPEELVNSQITELCGTVAPSTWSEQRGSGLRSSRGRSPGCVHLEDAICGVAGGMVEVDVYRAIPGETLVPGRHLHPHQPASVVASVPEGETQVVADLEVNAASDLPPPHEGVDLPKLPVVVVVVKNVCPTTARVGVRPRAELHREFSPRAEEAEEAAAVHARARDGAGQGGDAGDLEGRGGGEGHEEDGDDKHQQIFSQHVSLSH